MISHLRWEIGEHTKAQTAKASIGHEEEAFLDARQITQKSNAERSLQVLTAKEQAGILQSNSLDNCIVTKTLIQSGGGTGPMKPGNRQFAYCVMVLNPARRQALRDERESQQV